MEFKNFTRPGELNREDKPEDWLYCMLAFTRAIGEAIPEGYGVVIEPYESMVEIKPEVKKMLICNYDNMVRIVECDDREDLKQGDWIQLLKEDVISN